MTSAPRRISLVSVSLGILMLCALVLPAAANTVIYESNITEYLDTSLPQTKHMLSEKLDTASSSRISKIVILDISKAQNLAYIILRVEGTYGGMWLADESPLPIGRTEFVYKFNGQNRTGVLYVDKNVKVEGIGYTEYRIFLNEWDIGSLSDRQVVELPFSVYDRGYHISQTIAQIPSGPQPSNIYFASQNPTSPSYVWHTNEVYISYASTSNWENRIQIYDEPRDSFPGYGIYLQRRIGGYVYPSTLTLYKNGEEYRKNDNTYDIDGWWHPAEDIDNIVLKSPSKEYTFPLGSSDTPDDPSETSGITVYIKNSQTGALIANANVAIDALVDGEYCPIVNRTEPSGIFTITLQPTGGGKPNPDGYRLIVTADGYNNPMPEINFTVDDYKQSIYCLLDPIAGGPADENKTFIDFFVRDMSSNPISGATVKFGKYTLITNSAGYTVFEVDKNNNYSWTISKSGYGALTGNAVIGDAPRHTINTVLAPAVTPTKPTSIPTSPSITPTSTMTAPTGEPVSNWLDWFAAHFGMILGGGVEIGKIFMWLCFTVPVGVYVGKEAKAGAAGFMAGAGIVTLFFVLIGWVPIWLVVLMALIIGLLYAKVFNSQDNGGGR